MSIENLKKPVSIDFNELQRKSADKKVRKPGIPLLDAAEANSLTGVRAALARSGCDVNARAPGTHWTALNYAARAGNIKMAEALLEAGADVAAMEISPLVTATVFSELKMLAFLIEAGMDVNVQSKGILRAAPLHTATDKIEALNMLLGAPGIDVNIGDAHNETPLMSAAGSFFNKETAEEALRILIAHGADLDAQDKYGKTALHHAIEREEPARVEILLAAGADPRICDVSRYTPAERIALQLKSAFRWKATRNDAEEREQFAQKTRLERMTRALETAERKFNERDLRAIKTGVPGGVRAPRTLRPKGTRP